MSQRVPATKKIKESSLKGPSCSGRINRRLPYAKKVLCLQPVTFSEKTLNGTGLKTNHPVGFLFVRRVQYPDALRRNKGY